jgi:hypothetical protein
LEDKDRETVSMEQIAITNMYQIETLMNVLERKGLLTSKEVLAELELVVATKGGKEIN